MRRARLVMLTAAVVSVTTLAASGCTPEQLAQMDPGTAHFLTGLGDLITFLLFLLAHGVGYIL